MVDLRDPNAVIYFSKVDDPADFEVGPVMVFPDAGAAQAYLEMLSAGADEPVIVENK